MGIREYVCKGGGGGGGGVGGACVRMRVRVCHIGGLKEQRTGLRGVRSYTVMLNVGMF